MIERSTRMPRNAAKTDDVDAAAVEAVDAIANAFDATPEPEWETVAEPLPETWDFQFHGILVGNYLGSRLIETETPDGDRRNTPIHDFENVRGVPNATLHKRSVWGAYQIDAAFSVIEYDDKGEAIEITPNAELVGKLCKVELLGSRDIDRGRSVKDFRVQVAKS